MTAIDIDLGRRKLDWARSHMPVHAQLRARYGDSRPLAGMTVAVASHIEAKTGVFIETLAAAGAEVVFTCSVAATTQDDVVAALNEQPNVTGYARHDAAAAEVEALHLKVLDHHPNFILDDAAELTAQLVHQRRAQAGELVGMCEQTSTGVQRLRAMEREGLMTFPAYAVNDTPMKHDFDNVHGTGESSLANLALTTNLLLAGKRVVVAGYGYCGQGVANKAKGWGARVAITEVDPRKALRAHMAGFDVASMQQAAGEGEVFITATGNRDVLRREHFESMRDGAVIANAGHFNVEVCLSDLDALAVDQREVRPGISEYRLSDGRRINVVAGADLVNLAAPTAMGHPVEVMDQTFAMQFVAAVHLLANCDSLAPGVHKVPDEVDQHVARLKLETLNIHIDTLTDAQRSYLDAWRIDDIRA
ncbi:MAG: adenosylhomocysteinase [Gammaproteobacteria bacterium]